MGVGFVQDRVCFGDIHTVEGQRGMNEGIVYTFPGIESKLCRDMDCF
jgi:hypothetical protein